MPKKTVPIRRAKGFPGNSSFPAPKFHQVRDLAQGSKNCQKFFEYWKELGGTIEEPKEAASLLETRWYRLWPIIDVKMVDPDRTDTWVELQTGPLWFEDPDAYLEEVPKLLGSGEWLVCLNEIGVHGALCQARFSAVDLNQYPPKLDLKTLVKGNVKNEDYIRWLSANGIKTPWGNSPEEEEEQMAGEILGVVTEAIKEQSKMAIDATRELAEVRVEAAQDEVDRMRGEQEETGGKRATVENEGIKMIASAAKDMIQMAREDRRPPFDPVEMFKATAEIMRPRNDTSGVELLAAKMAEMQTQNLEFMRQVVGMRKNVDGSWSPAEPKTSEQKSAGGWREQLQDFQSMADLLGFRRPSSEVVHVPDPVQRVPEKSFWSVVAENPQPFLMGATALFTLAANIVYNIFAGGKAPVNPNDALQRASAAAPPPPVQQQPPPQQKVDPKDVRSWLSFAQQIEVPFKAHFLGHDSGLSGYSFAELLISNGTGTVATLEGRATYSSMKENLKANGFVQLIGMYKPLADLVRNTPEAFQKFTNELFTYDEMMEAQQVKEGAVA